VTRRGLETRAAILAAARRQFAECGYDRATIRAVAADAQIDPAMVMRYFGNKAGLFQAVAAVELHLPDLTLVPEDQRGAAMLASFFQTWEEQETFTALVRSAATSDVAAAAMRDVFMTQVFPMIAAVVPDHPERRAGLVGTQILGLAEARYILKIPPVAAMSRAELVQWIGPTLQRYLMGALEPAAPA
jgi:AcrR family transcriptional regulator